MKTQTENYLLNYLSLIIVYIFLFFFLQSYLGNGRPLNLYTYIGIILLVFSIILFTVARIQLGGAFQASAEAIKLVKTGIYKKIRHPVYLFGAIFFLGMIFVMQRFLFLLIWLILIGFQIRRIRKEEKILTEKFGNEYLEYKKQTWF